jgi:hypothetical protein
MIYTIFYICLYMNLYLSLLLVKEKKEEGNTKIKTDFEKTEIICDTVKIIKRTIDNFHRIK